MRKLILFFFLCGIVQALYAQEPDTNSYRSTSNPYYWKNKKPYEGYWQQDVHYTIKASIDEKTDIVDAEEVLAYYNNSPHDLDRVYFNLYNKNYEPGSYLDDLHHANKVYPKYGKYEQQHLTTEVSEMKYNGRVMKTELDGSILAVYLDKPIKAGETATFNVKFKTYFDINNGVRRRTKVFNSSGYHHFDGVLWYPRIAVYDRKFGWVTDQHLGREFYGDFGSFNVELTFANDYVVDATGLLLNEDEVLPEALRKKLDISNFKDKPWGSPPSVITQRDGTKKTWKFYAKNVHDFGFTADPTYRIGEVKWNNIRCFSFVQEPNASRWQNAATYLSNIIRVYSTDFGMYCWPKISVCDARDGMEYPMMTLDGGNDPDYRTLFTHEVGHQWFYGQIGSNEAYRAALDEGFTQFLTVWAYEKIDGPILKELPAKSKYIRKRKEKDKVRETKIFLGYLGDAIEHNDMPLTTHSDDFNGALRQGGGYRHVYVKTATMLQNLQYVLGEELFLKAMKNYFNEWKIAHPYIEDFRSSIINYTHADLNWFFDQWFETTKVIDYSISGVSKGKEGMYKVEFKRKGSMQMPLDFTVTTKDSSYNYHIPNTWFVKETKATVLPRWIGWGKLKDTYTAEIKVPGKIKNVQIDTSGSLADIDMRNNSLKKICSWKFDHKVFNYPDRFHYQVNWRPDLWYNGYDGVKAGIHFNGSYMNTRGRFSFTTWFNTGLGQQEFVDPALKNNYGKVNYNFSYQTNTPGILKHSSIFADSRFLDGLYLNKIGFEIGNYESTNRFYVFAKSMLRPTVSSLQYLLYPFDWNHDMFNNTLNAGFEHKYTYKKGTGVINLATRASALYSDYQYGYVSMSAINNNRLGKFDLRTRTYIQYGTGNNWAPESFLYIAGANPEELMENKFARSAGIIPKDWGGYNIRTNHFQEGGGLNLRGYAGYLAVEEIDNNGGTFALYKSTAGASVSAELDFSKAIGIKKALFRNTLKIETYLFTDIGIVNKLDNKRFDINAPRADAGLGTLWTIQRWGPLQMVKPLTLRVDMPMFLNRPPNAENGYFQPRWIIGIGKSF